MVAGKNRSTRREPLRGPGEPRGETGGAPEWPARLKVAAELVQDLECGAVITDRGGSVRLVNAALCRKLGYENAERLSCSPSFRPFGEHTGRTCASMWGTVLTGRVWNGRVSSSTQKGKRHKVALLVVRLTDLAARKDYFLALHASPEKPSEVAAAKKAINQVLAIWKQ